MVPLNDISKGFWSKISSQATVLLYLVCHKVRQGLLQLPNAYIGSWEVSFSWRHTCSSCTTFSRRFVSSIQFCDHRHVAHQSFSPKGGFSQVYLVTLDIDDPNIKTRQAVLKQMLVKDEATLEKFKKEIDVMVK